MMKLLRYIIVLLNLPLFSFGKPTKPNIVLIIADDLGWNDVSFHGTDQMLTPNIDLLAYSGISLDRYHTHASCTPSRSALLTGKFSHVIGMQGYPMTNGESRHIPLDVKILPQYFKELGYATHLVGKWHVGHAKTEYLPTSRGFDSHFGHRAAYIDYYEYTLEEKWTTGKVSGLDLYRNLEADWNAKGYITDIYNDEAKLIIHNHNESEPLFLMLGHNAPHCALEAAVLQAPPEDVRATRHIVSPSRRILGGMIKKLDESVGDVINTLLEKQILNNTIVVLISDNGGMTTGNSINYASNWPLRGIKMSPFEGGTRVVGLLWSPMLEARHSWNGYMHVADWLPTLLGAVGAEIPSDIDGVNLWDSITLNKNSNRTEFYEINDYDGFTSIVSGKYKLISGTTTKNYSMHLGHDLREITGELPSYKDSIENSQMYDVLNKIGLKIPIDEVDILKQRSKVACNNKDKPENKLCYPSTDKVCLFNLEEDPCEYEDISTRYPDVVEVLLNRTQVEVKRTIPRVVPLYRDPRSLPKLFNYTWSTFLD